MTMDGATELFIKVLYNNHLYSYKSSITIHTISYHTYITILYANYIHIAIKSYYFYCDHQYIVLQISVIQHFVW